QDGMRSLASEPVAKALERGPARVRRDLGVFVRLEVEVDTADKAQPGAVGAAENLLGKLERDRVAAPLRQLEAVVDDIDRLQLLVSTVVVRVVLARIDRDGNDGILEAAH